MFASTTDLDRFIETHLAPNAKEIRAELSSSRLLRFALLTTVFVGGALILTNFVLILILKWDFPIALFMGSWVLVLISILLIFILALRKPAQGAKQILLPPLLQRHGDWTLWSESKPLYADIPTTNLIGHFTSAHERTAFVGTFLEAPFLLSDMQAWRTTRIGGSSRRQPVFNGILIHFERPSSIKGHFGLFPDSIASGPWPRIKLESNEFEGLFDFYGTDPIEGRKLMPPHVISLFTELAEIIAPAIIHIIFTPDTLSIAVQRNGDWIDQIIAKNPSGDLKALTLHVDHELEVLKSIIKAVRQPTTETLADLDNTLASARP